MNFQSTENLYSQLRELDWMIGGLMFRLEQLLPLIQIKTVTNLTNTFYTAGVRLKIKMMKQIGLHLRI